MMDGPKQIREPWVQRHWVFVFLLALLAMLAPMQMALAYPEGMLFRLFLALVERYGVNVFYFVYCVYVYVIVFIAFLLRGTGLKEPLNKYGRRRN